MQAEEDALRFLDAKEVARLLGISRTRVWELVRHGVLPPGVVVHVGRRVLFSVPGLNRWAEAGGTTRGAGGDGK